MTNSCQPVGLFQYFKPAVDWVAIVIYFSDIGRSNILYFIFGLISWNSKPKIFVAVFCNGIKFGVTGSLSLSKNQPNLYTAVMLLIIVPGLTNFKFG